jgi:hypothetical protein
VSEGNYFGEQARNDQIEMVSPPADTCLFFIFDLLRIAGPSCHATGMILHVNSDATEFSEAHVRSRSGGYVVFSSSRPDDQYRTTSRQPPS